MHEEKILITVKTYPTLSKKYKELVCTAGIKEDGNWIRIYPLPFRFLKGENKFAKYQWISLLVEKNKRDHRPESFNAVDIGNIDVGERIKTGKLRDWEERKKYVLKNVKYDLAELIKGAHNNDYSLAVFKPKEVLDFSVEETSNDNFFNKKEIIEEQLKQGSLLNGMNADDEDMIKTLMPKIPYKFKYKFRDEQNKISNLMIEDWEVCQLYLSYIQKGFPHDEAFSKVKAKYLDDFYKTKDLHFFLGTTLTFHNKKAPNPYVIVGTFHPPHARQQTLL